MSFNIASVPSSKKKTITLDRSSISSTLTDIPIPIVLGSSVGKNSFDVSDIFTDLARTTVTAKSVIFDCADNYGNALMGIRKVEFYFNGSKITLTQGSDYVAYATSQYSSTYAADDAFNSSSKTGFSDNASWQSNSVSTNQRLIIVFNTTQTFDKIVVNNYHHNSQHTTRGVNNVVITASTDEITNTTYEATISNATVLFDGSFSQHPATNTADDQTYVEYLDNYKKIAITVDREITEFLGNVTRSAWVTASEHYSEPNYPASKVFDGAETLGTFDRWISLNNSFVSGVAAWDVYLDFDFQESMIFIGVAIERYSASYGGVTKIQVYASDTGDFSGEETTFTATEASADVAVGEYSEWFDFNSLRESYRYYRIMILEISEGDSGMRCEIAEVKFKKYTEQTIQLPIEINPDEWFVGNGVEEVTAKSVVFDIADNHGHASYLAIRKIEFYHNDSRISLTQGTDYDAYATTEYSSDYAADDAFNDSSKIGSSANAAWSTSVSNVTNQRLIIVFDASKTFDKIVINNYHDSGSYSTQGVNNVVITASTDEITNTTYEATISNATVLFDGSFSQHPASNTVDDQTYYEAILPKAVIWTKVSSYTHDADVELTLHWDETQDDNTTYAGVLGQAAETSVFSNSDMMSNAGWGNYTVRVKLDASLLSGSGDQVKVLFRHIGTNYDIDKCYIGHAASSGNAWDFDGNQVQVTFGGNTGVTINADEYESDAVSFDLDDSKAVIVSIDFGISTVPRVNSITGVNNYYKASADEAELTAPNGYTTVSGQLLCVCKIKTVAPAPNQQVWSNGFEFVLRPQDPTGDIYDSVNTAVGTVYGAPTLETVDGYKCISFNGTSDYITFPDTDDLDLTGGAYTIEAFFNPDDTSRGGLLNKLQATSPYYGWLLEYSYTAGKFQVFVNDSSSAWESNTTALSAGNWYLATGQSGQYYLNGSTDGTNTQNAQAAATTTPVTVGADYTSSRFDGYISLIFVSSVVRSADWIAIFYEGITDNIATWSAFVADDSSASGSFVSGSFVSGGSAIASGSAGPIIVLPIVRTIVDLNYDLTYQVRDIVNLLYGDLPVVRQIVDLVYGVKLAVIVNLMYGNLPKLRKIVNLPYGDYAKIRKIVVMRYGDKPQYRQIVELMYHLRGQLRQIVDLPYHIIDQQLRTIVDMKYDLRVYDELRKIVDMVYSIASGESIEEITTISVTTESGYTLDPFHINVEKDEGSAFIDAEIRTNVEEDYEACSSLTEVDIVVNDDTYKLIVEERLISRSRSTPDKTYTIRLVSKGILLDSPYATPISEELTGMASTIAKYLVAKELTEDDVEWNMIDWYIPPDTFIVNNETPMAALEELVQAGGGIRQSKKDGTLECRREFPTNIPDYDTATPGVYYTDQDNFYSVNTETIKRSGYNNFFISDQEPEGDDLTIEVVDISSYEKEVRVYQVPWDSTDTIRLNTSGGSWTSIQQHGVKTETIEDEEVEFVDGAAGLKKSIYSLGTVDYRETDLGDVEFKEDGSLTAETDANSLAYVTYTTKFWKFIVRDTRIEKVQYWPEVV